VVFAADDFGAWLIGALADAGRKKLVTLVLGSDQERALQAAATAAVERTAAELRTGDQDGARQLAMVVSEVFAEPVPAQSLAGQQTLLEALGTGIGAQLAVLDDASLTGTGQSSADVLGVPGGVIASALTGYLLAEIVTRGAWGGPLFPLASQLNHDVTHLEGQRLEGMLGQLADEVRAALARVDASSAIAAPTALAQLPAPTAGFIGRDDELAVLADLLNPAGAAGPVLVSAVAGLAGVGKTTLAVAAGHAAVKQGWYDGGVLFIDLHGYDDRQVEPGQALDALLRALGVPADHIPPTTEEQAALYRSVLAQILEPVLVIADNASSEAQVRPLLPGAGPHTVLVTSRNTLAGLGARLVDITVLDEDTAVELLDVALRTARPGDNRITADPQAARQLAKVCDGLPLALEIAAALLTADPTLAASELATELSVGQERLERLRYDDGSRTGIPSVAAAFALSYRRLGKTAARLFRLLPINPGPDVSTAAAAVLADLPVTKVREVLGSLTQAHLVEASPGTVGRWKMHDLLRLFAVRLSDIKTHADDREQARGRLLDYYLSMAAAADEHLRALPGMAVPAQFTSRDDALAWLDAERASLVGAISMAAETGWDQIAIRLPLELAGYFNLRRRFDDWLATISISLNTARRVGDRQAEATALGNLGAVLGGMRRFGEAVTAHEEHLAIARQAGDRRGEVMALGNLGLALREVGRSEEAVIANRDAVAVFREIGDRQSVGMALGNLSTALQEAGRFEEAATANRDAAAIFREIGDRQSVGMALDNLGLALREAGRFEEAVTANRDAVAVFQEIGDRQREGMAIGNLGAALQEAGRFEEAVAAHEEAAAIFRETADRHSEGTALDNLGLTLQEMQRFEEAVAAHEEAAAIFRQTGDEHSERDSLGNLNSAKAAWQGGD
jgi:tetratricopeptide (TPR) repeat protein